MTCAACSARVEKVTSAVAGVEKAEVNLLAGTMAHQIVELASELLGDPMLLTSMQLPASPFGDGQAAQRIADVLARECEPRLDSQRLAA